MSSIDERVVNMRFNNSGFAAGIRNTLGLLDSLKAKLNFSGATKSVQELDAAGKRFSLAPMASGVDAISTKFNALSIAGVAALAAIGVKAVSVGAQLAKSLTIDPIMQGLQEYETGLNSVQTILANTQHEGTNLNDVNAALKELNTYSDQTIYNFAEMAKNIGTFTAAGVSLDTSTAAIKGIANLAAVSGSNSQQASTAMYQLSQALGKGKVTLEDWNSVVNAGMGGKVFQDSLMETARVHGVAVDDIVKDAGSFRDSLQDGWITSDILTETLSKFTGDLNEQQLKTMGYTEEQIQGIMKMSKVAQDAATKVKTASQLIGTLQEAAQSGWAESWQTIIGDFEQAKELWTSVNDVIGGAISDSADARNKMLKDWADLGGRDVAIDAIKNAFEALMSVLRPVREAFRDIFPQTTGAQLYAITVALRDFMASLRLSGESSENLKRTFRGFFALLDIGRMIVRGIITTIFDLIGAIVGGSGGVLEFTGSIGDLIVKLRDFLHNTDYLPDFFQGLGVVLRTLLAPIGLVVEGIGRLFRALRDSDALEGFGESIGRLEGRLSGLPDLGSVISTVWEGVVSVFRRVREFFSPLAQELGDFFGKFGTMVADALNGVNFDQALDLVNTGLFAALVVMLKNFLGGGFVDQIKEAFGFGGDDEGGGLLDGIKEAIGGVTDTLSAMQAQLKAGTLIKIAGAIALLAASVVALSLVDSEKLTSALVALTVMFTQLGVAGTALQYAGTIFGAIKLGVLGAGLIGLATAVLILSGAVKTLADLNWNDLAKGLTGIAVILGSLAIAANLMSKHTGGLISASIAMIAVAAAVKILASAVKDFSGLSWEELAKGLGSVAAILVSLGIFTKLSAASKGAMVQAAGLVVLASAMKIFASAVGDFADMQWDDLLRGMAGLAGVLTSVGLAMRLMPSAGLIGTATSLVIVGGALKIVASALGDMSGMSWDEIGRGLTVLAGALTVIAIAMKIMSGTLAGAAALIVVAGALNVLVGPLTTFAAMGWDEIGRGLTVLAGALTVIAIAVTAMVGALPGAAALIVVAGALALLAPVMVTLGGLSWTEIGMGLVALAGAFTVIGVAGLLLTPVVPVLIGLGVAIALLGVGAIGVSVALTAFAVALTALAVAGTAAGTALVAMVAGLLSLIPLAFTKLGEGIVALAGVITAGAPAIVGAIVAVLQSLLRAIIDISPQIGQAISVLVQMMINVLVENIPRLVDAGMQLLLAILNGINSRIGEIVNVASAIIVAFVNGIASNMPQIAQSGANLAVSFVNSVADAIRANSGAMNAAGLNLASAIIDGMVNGVSSGIGAVAAAAGNVARSALDQVKSFLGIASPSKEFHKIGAWSSEGMALGFRHQEKMVATAATGVGQTAMSSMRSALSGLGDLVGQDIDIDPTVRPVLDLTDIRRNASLIDDMLESPSIDPSRAFNRAVSIANTQRSQDTALGQTSAIPVKEATQTIFNQYNHSPKALSSIEIYRQTKNQLSAMKG